MNSIFVAAALVGVLGFIGAVIGLVIKATKVIDSQLNAMHENTLAVQELSEKMTPLRELVAGHEARLNVIEPIVLEPYKRRAEEGRSRPRPTIKPRPVGEQ